MTSAPDIAANLAATRDAIEHLAPADDLADDGVLVEQLLVEAA